MTLRPNQVPCVFRDPFIRTQVDPRVQEEWKARWGQPAPFGDLRKVWKGEHCLRLSDNGSPATCPYSVQDCSMAFLLAVRQACGPDVLQPRPFFRVQAKIMALKRADEKPRARDDETPIPTFLVRPPDPSDRSGRSTAVPGSTGAYGGVHVADDAGRGEVGSEAGLDLHRPAPRGRRPVRLGDLLGSYDPRSRPAGPGSDET